jgi:hypothetical protein
LREQLRKSRIEMREKKERDREKRKQKRFNAFLRQGLRTIKFVKPGGGSKTITDSLTFISFKQQLNADVSEKATTGDFHRFGSTARRGKKNPKGYEE